MEFESCIALDQSKAGHTGFRSASDFSGTADADLEATPMHVSVWTGHQSLFVAFSHGMDMPGSTWDLISFQGKIEDSNNLCLFERRMSRFKLKLICNFYAP